jgi:probable F420-dependent oxidoreductase
MTFGLPLRQAAQLARDAEAAGFTGVVVTEGGRTAYLTCAAMTLAAQLELSTGIAVAFPRSPMVTAQVAWELQEASGGRFRLGLGSQVRAHVERRYGVAFDPPGPRLREYVLALKACFRAFRGEPLAFDGRFWRLSLLPPMWSPGPIAAPDPPIDVAAVNPWMLRMAGEVADGIHVHPLNHPRYLAEVVRPNIDAGAVRAGRDPNALSLTVPAFTAVGRTPGARDRWRELARAQVAFYGSTPNYAFIFDMLGFEGTTARIRERQKMGDLEGMAKVVDDELLAHFLVEATPDELPDRLRTRYGGIADRVVLYFAGLAWRDDPGLFAELGAAARELSASALPENASTAGTVQPNDARARATVPSSATSTAGSPPSSPKAESEAR